MNDKKLVIVDVDGVIADFRRGQYLNLKHNGVLTTEFWQNPPYDFWFGLNTLIDSKSFHTALEGYNVLFFTNCPNPIARKDWLIKHGFWKDEYGLICGPLKTSKRNVLSFIKPFAFIDDYLGNIEEARTIKEIAYVFHFDQDQPKRSWETITNILQR